jgi:hypothetical protein
MKNREAVLKKLDGLDSNLNKLNMSLNQADRQSAYETIEVLREQVEQIKGYIENEPISGSELNKF